MRERQLRQLSTSGDSLGSEIAFGKFPPLSSRTSVQLQPIVCMPVSQVSGSQVPKGAAAGPERGMPKGELPLGFPSDFCC